MGRTMLGAAALVGVIVAGTAARAQSYDGRWMVPIPGVSPRCPSVNVHIGVKGDRMEEVAGAAGYTFKFFGRIAPDGSFNLTSPGGHAWSKGRFAGNTVTADFTDSQCPTRQGSGSRVP